jgi:hypothetical protein
MRIGDDDLTRTAYPNLSTPLLDAQVAVRVSLVSGALAHPGEQSRCASSFGET